MKPAKTGPSIFKMWEELILSQNSYTEKKDCHGPNKSLVITHGT
jgi:hypothetical protein